MYIQYYKLINLLCFLVVLLTFQSSYSIELKLENNDLPFYIKNDRFNSSLNLENRIKILPKNNQNSLLGKKLTYKRIDTIPYIRQFMWYWMNQPFDYNPSTGIYSYVVTNQNITNDRNLYIRTSNDLSNWSNRIPIYKTADQNEIPLLASLMTIKKGNDNYGILASSNISNNDVNNVQSYVNLSRS